MKILIPVLIYIFGLLAILIEMFLPAAGIIGIFGFSAICTSIFFIFKDYGILWGNIAILFTLCISPFLLVFYFKIFPKSFIGKWLILKKDDFPNQKIESKKELFSIKKQGTTISVLRPSGIALFDEHKITVYTNGEYIEKNQTIEIIKINGNKIYVKSLQKQEEI